MQNRAFEKVDISETCFVHDLQRMMFTHHHESEQYDHLTYPSS